MFDGKHLRAKLVGSDDERAVSPVIGVILMVAITVILAAVIAAFVMDMGSNQSANANAGLEINENLGDEDGDYNVTVTSLGDNTVGVYCSSETNYGDADKKGTTVGSSFTCDSGNSIIGVTDDGSENAIQTNIGN